MQLTRLADGRRVQSEGEKRVKDVAWDRLGSNGVNGDNDPDLGKGAYLRVKIIRILDLVLTCLWHKSKDSCSQIACVHKTSQCSGRLERAGLEAWI